MRRRLAYVLVPFFVLGTSAAIISGCGQSIGEKCQIDSDCESGLICNTGTGVCQSKNAAVFDTNLTPDTAPVDGPADARPADARPIDARPIDAGPPDANM